MTPATESEAISGMWWWCCWETVVDMVVTFLLAG